MRRMTFAVFAAAALFVAGKTKSVADGWDLAAELIASSRLLVYENAAHALPYTHTDRMLADIVAFAGA